MAKKYLIEFNNKDHKDVVKKVSNETCTGVYETTIGNILDLINNHELVIPEGQRTPKVKGKGYKIFATNYIVHLICSAYKMENTDETEFGKRLNKRFKKGNLITTGSRQSIAIAINPDSDKMECEDGQHKYFYVIPGFIGGEIRVTREDLINNGCEEKCMEALFENCKDASLGFDNLNEELQEGILNLPVIANIVESKDSDERNGLFVAENTANAIKDPDINKSNNVERASWYLIDRVLNKIDDKQEIILAGKTIKKEDVEKLREIIPSKKNTAVAFINRNMLLYNCNAKNPYAWKKGQSQREENRNYYKCFRETPEEKIEEMLLNVLKALLSIAKDINDSADRKALNVYNSFTTGIAYHKKVIRKPKTKVEKKDYKIAVNACVDKLLTPNSEYQPQFNNAHYVYSKLDTAIQMMNSVLSGGGK